MSSIVYIYMCIYIHIYIYIYIYIVVCSQTVLADVFSKAEAAQQQTTVDELAFSFSVSLMNLVSSEQQFVF